MDLNVRIIEAVRNCPSLYQCRGVTFMERKKTWKELAERLNIQEQYLKLRWHSLVQRYQRDREFKYREQMQFLRDEQLVNTTKLQAADTMVSDWPEFIITEKDLIDAGRPEEYLFLDIGGKKAKSHQTNSDHLQKPKHRRNSEHSDVANKTQCQASPTVDKTLPPSTVGDSDTPSSQPSTITSQHKNEEKMSMTPLIRLQLSKDVMALAESGKEITLQATKSDAGNSNTNNSSTGSLSPETKSTVQSPRCADGQSPAASESPQKSNEATMQPERSEDIIFGELIVAMLKQMDEEKKRTVKKEIMNLLLT